MADVCGSCGQAITPDAEFCGACGAAVASAEGAARPPRGHVARKYRKKSHQKTMQSGRNAILAVAVLQTLGAGVIAFLAKEGGAEAAQVTVLVAVGLGVAVVFWGLWLWAKWAPLAAAVTALVVFVTLHAADAIVDPISIVRGILMKVIVLVCLFSAIKSAVRYRKLQAAGLAD